MKRRLTAIAAAVGLTGIVIGLPLLLIATHNVAAPRLGWSPQALWQALTSPDDGTLLVTVVKLVGWISWAVLTTSITIEVLSRLRHLPVPQLRGLAWPQLLARGLVTAVLAGFLAVNNVNDLATGAAAAPHAPTAGPPAATAPLHAPDRNPAPASHRYTVQRGDTLSEIALDELGDGHAYPSIYKASKHTLQPDGRKLTDPDLIIPGWKLTIPDRHDTTRTPDKPTRRHETDHDSQHPEPAASPTPSQGSGTAPTGQPATPTAAGQATAAPQTGASRGDSAAEPAEDADHVTPSWQVAGLAGAGALLAGAMWLLLHQRRRAQQRARRPGRTIAEPRPGLAPIEKTVIHIGGPTSDIVTAVHNGLRRLAADLAAADQPLPTLLSLRLTDTTILTHFSEPAGLPAPWQQTGEPTQWQTARDALEQAGPADEDAPPPWPQLVTIGMDDEGGWRLLNLEALGVVSITGDPDFAADLARYLASELGVVPWARDLRIDCLGVCAELASLNPARIHCHDTADVVGDTVAAAVSTNHLLATTTADTVEQARAAELGDRLWDSRILVTSAGVTDLPALAELIQAKPSATATSLLVIGNEQAVVGVQMQVGEDGRVRVPHLGLDLVANGLTPAEARGSAAILAAGDTLEDAPIPAVAEPAAEWEEYCDEAGQLRDEHTLPREAEPSEPASSLLQGNDDHWVATTANTVDDLAALAPQVPTQVSRKIESIDPTLDDDLALWAAKRCERPRLGVLGTSRLRVGPGGDPSATAKRTPYYTEIVAYLATKNGATTGEVATAMRLAPSRVRKDMNVVRDWLGDNPRTGHNFLPDAIHHPEAIRRGVGLYLVEDLLVDADLFRRLRLRAEARGKDGLPDLLAALRLVKGAPYEDLRIRGRAWLTDDRPDRYLLCAIVDVAHLVTSIALEAGDLKQARAAAELALLIAPDETMPALDLAAVAAKQGREDEAAALARSVVDWRDGSGDAPIELPERAERILRAHRWLAPDAKVG
jgi:hypothetical protein